MKKILLLAALVMLACLCAFAESAIECDTVYNGCVGLPVTWTVESDAAVQKYDIFDEDSGKLVYSLETNEKTLVYTPDEAATLSVIVSLENGETLRSNPVNIEAKLLFGVYEQDGNDSTSDPIEWTILSVEDGKALVISKYILKNESYFNPSWIKYKYTFWAYSYIGDFSTNYKGSQPEDPSRLITGISATSIPMKDGSRGTEEDLYNSDLHCRHWCNVTFYDAAFDEDEKARILLTHNVNADNPSSGVDGGPDTDDYIFFLSYDELNEYMPNASDRKCSQTAVAKKETKKNDQNYWWLRTPGQFRVNAAIVYGSNGHVTLYGTDVGHNAVGYRPCAWITIGG